MTNTTERLVDLPSGSCCNEGNFDYKYDSYTAFQDSRYRMALCRTCGVVWWFDRDSVGQGWYRERGGLDDFLRASTTSSEELEKPYDDLDIRLLTNPADLERVEGEFVLILSLAAITRENYVQKRHVSFVPGFSVGKKTKFMFPFVGLVGDRKDLEEAARRYVKTNLRCVLDGAVQEPPVVP